MCANPSARSSQLFVLQVRCELHHRARASRLPSRGTGVDPIHPGRVASQVTTSDRSGVLHNLISTLWECDLQVHKAHITTNPGDQALDMFWVSDNRQELPVRGESRVASPAGRSALFIDWSCLLSTSWPVLIGE